MNKKHELDRKKILFTDGHQGRYLDAEDLAQLACISIKHAYRLIADPSKITPTIHRLVTMQLLGSVPGWPPGWRIVDGVLYGPNGRGVSLADVDNLQLQRQLLNHAQRDAERLSNEVYKLRKRAAVPRELRVYINDDPEPRRVIDIQGKRRTA